MSEPRRQTTIAGQRFAFAAIDVRAAADRIEPEPIDRHYVVVGRRRFPPKQLVCAMTGLDRADLTTHQARRTLVRLGFVAGRRGARAGAPEASPGADPDLVAALRPLAGQWVAVKDDEVLYFADSPGAVVRWLASHDRSADSMFRVPEDEAAATGLAPR